MSNTRRAVSFGLVLLVLIAALAVPAFAGPSPQTGPARQTPTPDDWARAQAAGKIVVGTAADYEPFEFYSSNYQLDGFDIALFKELGKRLGVQIEFNDFAFDGLLDALRLGQVDAAIGAISITPDRKQVVNFSTMYYSGEDAALVRSISNGEIRSATDLKGKKVGVQRGTTYQAWVQQNLVDQGLLPQEDLVTFQDVNAMVRDLRNSKIDVALLGLLPAQQIDARYTDLKVAGKNFNKQQFGIAARKGSTLVAQLNEALLDVQQDGTFARLAQDYLGVAPSEIAPKPPTTTPKQPTPAPAPTATPGPPPCILGMAYVADLNFDDKNMTAPPIMAPGQAFVKKWRVKNSGTCAWEPDYSLNYVSGNRPEAEMGATPVLVGKRVEPGQTVDLAANLVAPTTYGTFQAYWKMRDDQGKSFGEVIWVGIQVPNPNPPPPPPPPGPSNPNLRADSNWINQGQCTTIRWDVDNVKAVYFIDGGTTQGVSGHDTRNVCPSVTTTYTLRVVGQNNQSVDYPITINVNNAPPPPTINFWVDNGTINAGQCTTLHWDVQNVREVYLNDQGVPGQGSQQVCPTSTTTYTLRVVRNDGGQETRQVTVTVTSAPQPGPSITSFYPSQNEISVGRCVIFSWGTSNTSYINMVRSGTVVYSNGPANGSFEDCPQSVGLYDYELQAFGNGQTSQRVSVNVIGPQPK